MTDSLRDLAARVFDYHRQHNHRLSLPVADQHKALGHLHSEVSEVWTCVRKEQFQYYEGVDGKPEGLPAEAADVLLCLLGFVTRTIGTAAFLDALEAKLVWVETHNKAAGPV